MSIVTPVAVSTLHRVLCLPAVVAAVSSPPTGRFLALVRRSKYSTIIRDVWKRLGGNGGAGGDGESHIRAYLRSTCQPLSAVPMPWERLRAVIEPGGGRPPATAHWAAAGPLWKVRSGERASNSAPIGLVLTSCLPLVRCLYAPAPQMPLESRAKAATATAATTASYRLLPPP